MCFCHHVWFCFHKKSWKLSWHLINNDWFCWENMWLNSCLTLGSNPLFSPPNEKVSLYSCKVNSMWSVLWKHWWMYELYKHDIAECTVCSSHTAILVQFLNTENSAFASALSFTLKYQHHMCQLLSSFEFKYIHTDVAGSLHNSMPSMPVRTLCWSES